MRSSHLRKRFLIVGALVLLIGIGMTAYIAFSTWGQVTRVSIERPDESEPGESDSGDEDSDQSDRDETETDPVPDTEGTDVLLLVGSDSREQLTETTGFGAFEGRRADVVMVVIRSRGEAAILSLPRDLWVESACDGENTRLNEELEGCGDALNGPTLLTLTVERVIGEKIDHFALVDLAGFQDAVDAIGGYEICLDRPVRDSLANLELPGGCTMASGEQTLAWLRSRHTEELTSQGWRTMPGVNDPARNARQLSHRHDGFPTFPAPRPCRAQPVPWPRSSPSTLSFRWSRRLILPGPFVGSEKVMSSSSRSPSTTTSPTLALRSSSHPSPSRRSLPSSWSRRRPAGPTASSVRERAISPKVTSRLPQR